MNRFVVCDSIKHHMLKCILTQLNCTTCSSSGWVSPVGKIMSLFCSSYGHLKSRWGQMGRWCACIGRELIAWHGSIEHLGNQCSGKSIWLRASSYFVLFCQCQKKEAAYLTLELFWVIYLSFHLFYYLLFFSMHLNVAYANNNKKYVQLPCVGHIFLKIK